MVYIDRISPFDAIDIGIEVKTDDLMTLDLEMLGTLKELVEKERRFTIKYLQDGKYVYRNQGNIEINIGDNYQRVISLDKVTIYDESMFVIDDHYIRIYFELNENVRMSATIAPGELQLNDIYKRLEEFRDEINELCNSPFVTKRAWQYYYI